MFYCTYNLELLTVNNSILHRYAYKNRQLYKTFKYFMVIEYYKYLKVNIVSVVGVPMNAISDPKYDFRLLQKQGVILLVDATSLIDFCDTSFKNN